MAVKQKILIVDDDANIAELISLYLLKECYDTKIVEDGESALREFKTYQPNLILLDLMLPGIDGYQVCREIRTQSNVPIIMLSAKGEVFDKVLGLELGADDYIIKPFDSKELVARVKAVLRRYQVMKPEKAEPEIKCVEYPDLVINLTNYSVMYYDRSSTCRQRSWNFCISLLPLQIRCSPENSFWTTSGAMNIWATHVPLTYMSNVSGKKSKITNIGGFQRYGASDTNSNAANRIYFI